MEKHKKKALEKDCRCSGCDFRFQCFTQERVFSDPMWQSLFEALMALGRSREDAVGAVAEEIKMKASIRTWVNDPPFPKPDFDPPLIPYVPYPSVTGGNNWIGGVGGTMSDNGFSIDDHTNMEDDTVQINYTMHGGEQISWYTDEFR